MEDLPDAVLMRILQYLPIRQYFRVRKICHRWRTVIDKGDRTVKRPTSRYYRIKWDHRVDVLVSGYCIDHYRNTWIWRFRVASEEKYGAYLQVHNSQRPRDVKLIFAMNDENSTKNAMFLLRNV